MTSAPQELRAPASSMRRSSGSDAIGERLDAMEVRGGTARLQDWLLFIECSEQVEESPLTIVEILSRNHEATPWGLRQLAASSTRRSSLAHCPANSRGWNVRPIKEVSVAEQGSVSRWLSRRD